MMCIRTIVVEVYDDLEIHAVPIVVVEEYGQANSRRPHFCVPVPYFTFFSNLKMKAVCFFEMPIDFSHIADDSTFHSHSHENF
jgi:hypothetical protein